MPWFGRSKAKVVDEGTFDDEKKKPLEDTTAKDNIDDDSPEFDEYDELNEKAQDVMADNLDIMRDIVFRIRDDPEFAKSIYANCPRLQKLLDEHPDLRPIFEDPKLVRINFEKVYRDQGGVLPEDEEENPGIIKRSYEYCMGKIAIITSHPIFKVFKIFMILKKVIGFLSPTKGFGVIKGFITGIFEDPDADPTDVDGDADAEGNPANLEMKMQLNAAAEHMEDPEVQERMEEMLENPDSMEESIENDPQLKALRDENELCAALMGDPDTMKILIDPDNLRALGEAPDLIEQDFLNPDGFVDIPDDQPGVQGRALQLPDAEVDAPELEVEAAEVEAAAEPEAAAEEGGNAYEDIAGEREDVESDNKAGKAKGSKQQQKKDEKKEGEKDEAKSWMHAAAGMVGGQAFAALGIGDLFGGGDDLDLGVEAPEVEAPEISAEDPSAALEGIETEAVAPEELVAPAEAEGGLEVAELEADVGGGKSKDKAAKGGDKGGGGGDGDGKGGFFGAAIGAASGLVAGTVLGSVLGSDHMGMVEDFQENVEDRQAEAEEEEEENKKNGEEGEGEDEKKKGRFAFVGAMKDFAKDQLIGNTLGAVLGDDLADGVLDTQEDIEDVQGEDEEEEEEEEDEEEDDSDDDRRQNSQRGAGRADDSQPSARASPGKRY